MTNLTSSNPLYYTGIDIGGTSIKAAIINSKGEIVSKLEQSTSQRGSDDVCNQMIQIIGQLKSESPIEIRGVGIAVPGFIDTNRGFVHASPNLRWKNVPLKEQMQSLTGLPVLVENDANAAALGEQWVGVGKTTYNLAMVTLGTGIGCGLVVDGKIVHGSLDLAGEIGHMKVMPEDGLQCVCGKKGCLETTSSGLAILQEGMDAVQNNRETILVEVYARKGALTVKDIFDAAKNRDTYAENIVSKAAFYLGIALANVANLLNPELIVLGGGISAAGSLYFDKVSQSFREFATDLVADNTNIVPAQLGNDAGVIGCSKIIHTSL